MIYKTSLLESQDVNFLLQARSACPYLRGPGEASHTDLVVPPSPGPIFITHAMTGGRKMRANMRSIDGTDLVNRGLAEEDHSFQLTTIQCLAACNHLPSWCAAERQTAHSAPIERSESQFPALVNRPEVCAILVSPDRRYDRVPSPVVQQMIKMPGTRDLLRLHRNDAIHSAIGHLVLFAIARNGMLHSDLGTPAEGTARMPAKTMLLGEPAQNGSDTPARPEHPGQQDCCSTPRFHTNRAWSQRRTSTGSCPASGHSRFLTATWHPPRKPSGGPCRSTAGGHQGLARSARDSGEHARWLSRHDGRRTRSASRGIHSGVPVASGRVPQAG